MNAKVKDLTVEQIDLRLSQLAQAERTLAGRDFEAELKDVLKAGGDADALEATQADQERQTRRIRAERAALQELRPEAVTREGEAMQQHIAKEINTLAVAAGPVVKEMVDLLTAVTKLAEQYVDANVRATDLVYRARKIASDTGAAFPPIGTFTSQPLAKKMQEFRDLDFQLKHQLASGVQIGGISYGKEIG